MESEAIFFLLYIHVDQFREIKQADEIIYKSLNIHAFHGMLQVIKRITNLLVLLVYFVNKNSRDHCNSLLGGKQSHEVAFHQVFGSQLHL